MVGSLSSVPRRQAQFDDLGCAGLCGGWGSAAGSSRATDGLRPFNTAARGYRESPLGQHLRHNGPTVRRLCGAAVTACRTELRREVGDPQPPSPARAGCRARPWRRGPARPGRAGRPRRRPPEAGPWCSGGRRTSRLGRRALQPAASTLPRSSSIQELACAATACIPVVFLVSGGTTSWRCRDRRRVGPGTFGTFGSGGGPGRTASARRAGGRAVVGASRDHADASCASAKRCTCAWTNSMSSITVVGGPSRASTRVFIPIRATGP